VMRALRRLVKNVVPGVEEGISWGIPFYRFHGLLGGFAVHKNHVSFGVGGKPLPQQIRRKLEAKGYRTGRWTIQIRFNQGIPTAELKLLLRRAVRENMRKRRVHR